MCNNQGSNMCYLLVTFFCVLASTYAQSFTTQSPLTTTLPTNLHNGLTERIGNFSIELLYHTSKLEQNGQNLILSPITAWTVLAVISEGASEDTALQINNALRISSRHRNAIRTGFQEIYEWLQVNTSTVELEKINAIFIDSGKLLQKDFQSLAESAYKTRVVTLDFKDSDKTANTINQAVSKITRGRIPKIVEKSYFEEIQMILTSAVYFKGQWTVPFNASQTKRMPFHNSTGYKIGEVNMMYNRYTYPFANIKDLQAKVIEMPYGIENRLSMLIMMPNAGVSLEDMFKNFAKVPLDRLFNELKVAKEEFAEDEVDCFIPRFKIESNLDLTNVLRNNLGIVDLFDQNRARLPYMARTPLYVTKVIHKAEIEVTEDGTTASGVTVAEFSNRIGALQFMANRPFCYLIVEKVTNSIVFGGLYETPSVY